MHSSEPDKVQRAKNWSIAIGLQQVDGLTPSDFLVSQAKENIEGGEINTEDVRHRLEEYYQQKEVRKKAEADGVSALLAQKAFTFSPKEWLYLRLCPHLKLFSNSIIVSNWQSRRPRCFNAGNAA